MYEHDIRWPVLVPVSVLLAVAMLSAEIFHLLPAFPARPQLLWMLAFIAGMKVHPLPALLAFFCCGLASDVFLGPKAGAGTLAYLASGLLIQYWKPLLQYRSWPGWSLAAGFGGGIVSALEQLITLGRLSSRLWDRIAVVSAFDGILTMVCLAPALLLLSLPSFRPWRELGDFSFFRDL